MFNKDNNYDFQKNKVMYISGVKKNTFQKFKGNNLRNISFWVNSVASL